MLFNARSATFALSLVLVSSPLLAQSPAPAAPAVSDAEAKLAITLRSYSLLDAEADRLKAANAKLTAEKLALEARLSEMQAAVPLASQAAGLRDQLRQTQAQMAAYAEENVQLRNKLGLAIADPAHGNASVASVAVPAMPVMSAAAATPAPSAPAPAGPRTHTIAAGDTLVKISQTYYGTPNRWSEILAANREVLRDEKTLVIGRSVIIP